MFTSKLGTSDSQVGLNVVLALYDRGVKGANNTLVLSQQASVSKVATRTASNNLVLIQEADSGQILFTSKIGIENSRVGFRQILGGELKRLGSEEVTSPLAYMAFRWNLQYRTGTDKKIRW